MKKRNAPLLAPPFTILMNQQKNDFKEKKKLTESMQNNCCSDTILSDKTRIK